MAEYIEREPLKRALRVWITECMIDGDNEIADGFRDCIDLIDDCPAADVAPVRHGQWERIGIRGRKGLQIYPCCSACGMVSAAYRSEWERGAWKFCPNCGASTKILIDAMGCNCVMGNAVESVIEAWNRRASE